MAFDLKKKREEVAQTGADLTKPQSGGGDFTPPAEGVTRLRMVGYVETGVHTSGGQYPKTKPRAEIMFELSGPKHEPKKLDDGTVIPFRVTVKEIVGTHAKNGYIKLFNLLNVDGDARNYLDLLLDKAWRGEVSYWKFKKGDKEVAIAQLKKGGVYNIKPVVYQDEETGETRQVAVPPALSPLRVFLWDDGDLDQWDTLLEYQKNKIRESEEFVGSPIYNALVEAKRDSELAVVKRDGDEPAEEPDEDAPAEAPAPAPAPAPKPAAKAPAKAPAAVKAPAKAATKPKAAAPAGDPLQGL